MKAAAILQSFNQNIFRDATVSASASPSTNYTLDTLLALRPDFRLRFDTTTLSITWDLGGGSPSVAQLGDIFVIPVCNLVDGVAVLTNDAGLTQAIPVPDPQASGHPRTIIVDLRIDNPDPDVRTSATWTLTITGNPENVVFGGAVALYGPTSYLVDRDFQWGYSEKAQFGAVDASNEYGTLYRQPTLTVVRSVELSTLATDADAARIRDWFDGNFGHGRPGLLWFDPDIEDAYLGYLQPEFSQQKVFTNANAITLTFTEMSKGLPL